MAFARPTLADLVSRIQSDLISRLELATPVLRRSVVGVLARVLAGAVHMLHGHLDYLARQLFPDLSDTAFLVRQAGLYGLARKAATYATGTITLTGSIGSVVPAGTTWTRADGNAYASSTSVALAAGAAAVVVTSSTAGADGACPAGAVLSLASPISGVATAAAVASGGLANASDPETDEDLRARLLARLAAPPHGGAPDDYVAWALEVPGVTRAWCFPREGGLGTVTVRFVRDGDAGSIIPDSGEVDLVQAYIGSKAPAAALVTVVAPAASAVNFQIRLSPSTPDTKAAVQAALAYLLQRAARPGGRLMVSQLQLAIGEAAGVTDFTLASPSSDLVFDANTFPVLGTFTWL